MKFVPSRIAAAILGVHRNTLRNWANNGTINYVRTPGNHRLYDVHSVCHATQKESFCYCRISSETYNELLLLQTEYMSAHYPEHTLITDIGNGLLFNREGLQTILMAALCGSVDEVVVMHRDRLSLVAFQLIEWIVKECGGRISVIRSGSLLSTREFLDDLLLCCKLAQRHTPILQHIVTSVHKTLHEV